MRPQPSSPRPKLDLRPALVPLAGLIVALVFMGSGVAVAQEVATEEPAPAESDETTPEDDALAEELREGAAVYTAICSSCHQPGGAGLPGKFPPLMDNPNADDAAYVTDVINNGQSGEIEVDGEIYNGVMPSFSTLDEDEVDAVIAYIQNDFVAPADENAVALPTGPVAGTELPALANMSSLVAFALAASVIALVLAPRVTSANSRLDVPWLDAWLKTAVIVFGVVFFSIIVPDWALKTETVSKLSRPAQDFIGVTLWSGGLFGVIGAMWYAHRESRI